MKRISFLGSLAVAGSLFLSGCGGGGSSGTTELSTAASAILEDSTLSDATTLAIQKIMAWAEDQSNPEPTVQDYIDAGISGVTEDNLDEINDLVASLDPEDVDTAEEIQNILEENGLVDVMAPVITLLGENPLTMEVNETYVEAGATALDNVDGNVTGDIVIDASDLNNQEVGNYVVKYTVEDSSGNVAEELRLIYVRQAPEDIVQPPEANITGSALYCDPVDVNTSDDAKDYNASTTMKRNISSTSNDPDSENYNRENPTAQNSLERMGILFDAKRADGTDANLTEQVYPLVMSYAQQIVGPYELSDGDADIGDPNTLDGIFVAISLDDGDTWKNYTVADFTEKSSMQVTWNGELIDYNGHSHKPTIAIEGKRILVAWHSKYCPTGNPLNLPQDDDGNYTTDYFAVNGPQRSIDYEGIIAPNGKAVYEVPFSCIWTARGILNEDGNITWHSPMQLTSGTRDSNHIWLESSGAGFAMAWQEDTEGMHAGGGSGPGEGWSGATTNHGSDIWYASLRIEDFDATDGTDENTSKPKSLNNFTYPVRITDNEKCQEDDNKLFCQYLCDTYGSVDIAKGNKSGDIVKRCLTYDTDMLSDTQVVMDGDTGASRPTLRILKTNEGENVVVLGYEETKGLSENTSGTGDQDQGEDTTDIELEGKSVYFESFNFNAIYAYDDSNVSTIHEVAMPLISAGNIVNVKSPQEGNTSNMIFENARRLVIGTQIDPCDQSDFTFAFLYKQSFDTQGASSDMFVRVNNGFTYDSFVPLYDSNLGASLVVSNVSAQDNRTVEQIEDYNVSWSPDNLDDLTYENKEENTFSPRLFLRGNTIYVGFEYTPNYDSTAQGNMPDNFHHNIYENGAWRGPVNVTQITQGGTTSVDARFFTTPKGKASGLSSDESNPNLLFITWGTDERIVQDDPSAGMTEGGIYGKRSTDNGLTWGPTIKVADREGTVIHEKEVGSIATPDGKKIYNVWIQEEDVFDPDDPFSGLDSWFGRIDYNISIVQ